MKIKAVRGDEHWWLDMTTIFKQAENLCEEGMNEIESTVKNEKTGDNK
jgi:hypothetical protein